MPMVSPEGIEVVKCEVSCDWRLQPKYLAKARGTSASKS